MSALPTWPPDVDIGFQPLADRVLIRRAAAETMSASGRLFIPENAKEAPLTGTVVACGRDVSTVKDGDVVMYPRLAGDVVKLDVEGEHLILREYNVLGVMDDD